MKIVQKIIQSCLFLFLGLASLQALAQTKSTNSQSIEEIVSPVKNALFKTNDTSDIVIKLRNQGPNDLFSTDRVKINLSINVEGQGTILTVDTILPFGKYLRQDDFVNFTILENYKFTLDDRYNICASAGGRRN